MLPITTMMTRRLPKPATAVPIGLHSQVAVIADRILDVRMVDKAFQPPDLNADLAHLLAPVGQDVNIRPIGPP